MSLSLIKTAWAETIPTDYPSVTVIPHEYQSIGGILGAVLNVVFYAGIALSVIFLIIGGIKYMTAGGDETKIAEARGQVTNAIIGFVIVVAAFSVRVIIKNLIGVDVTGKPLLPDW